MSLIEHAPGEVADDVLITRVRGGDLDAYGELFARHHESARRLARSLTRGADADDLVSDAFAKVLSALQKGSGPDIAFRAYLLTTVRRLHVDRIRAQAKATPTDDVAALDRGVPFSDTAVADFESSAAARAYGSLPERWQMVLWHLEVEGQKPADIAPMLGMSANAVAALAYRAREGLRQAFVQMHATEPATSEKCRETRENLGAYVREGLSKRESAKVADHLEECRRCTALYLELTEVNSSLAALLGPIVLGGAAAAYLAGSAATSGGAVAGVGFLVGRVRDVVVANSTTAAVTAATVAATAVGVGAYAAVNHGHHPQPSAGPGVVQEHTPVAPRTKAHHHSKPKKHPKARVVVPPAPSPSATPTATSTPEPPTGPAPATPPTTAPAPDKTPTPDAEPSKTPTPTPTPEPPPAISLSGPGTATGTAVLAVHGLPAGATGTVTVRVPLSLLWWITPGCHGIGRVRQCAVSASSPTVTVRFVGLVNRTFTASFTPAGGVEDGSTGDDSIVVRMRGLVPVGLPTDPKRTGRNR